MEIVYADKQIVVCIKPARVLSTDEPGGMPELIRKAMGQPDGDIRTVHRLDRVVSGLMVLARSEEAASNLSRQIRENTFGKQYLAVIHGCLQTQEDTLRDLLYRDKARRMTFVAKEPAKGVQEAVLDYRVVAQSGSLSKVLVTLHTGRTHQIRVQFASRGYPLVGERKYSTLDDSCELALWSHALAFNHPTTRQRMTFSQEPPKHAPWDLFEQTGGLP